MSVISASPTEHRCSCGRTFLNKISLERHIWVTKHEAVEAAPAEPLAPQRDSKETLVAALRILREKQAVQHNFDLKRRQKRRLRRELMKIEDALMSFAGQMVESAKSVGSSVLTVARFVVTTAVLSGLVVAGMKLGTFLPG